MIDCKIDCKIDYKKCKQTCKEICRERCKQHIRQHLGIFLIFLVITLTVVPPVIAAPSIRSLSIYNSQNISNVIITSLPGERLTIEAIVESNVALTPNHVRLPTSPETPFTICTLVSPAQQLYKCQFIDNNVQLYTQGQYDAVVKAYNNPNDATASSMANIRFSVDSTAPVLQQFEIAPYAAPYAIGRTNATITTTVSDSPSPGCSGISHIELHDGDATGQIIDTLLINSPDCAVTNSFSWNASKFYGTGINEQKRIFAIPFDKGLQAGNVVFRTVTIDTLGPNVTGIALQRNNNGNSNMNFNNNSNDSESWNGNADVIFATDNMPVTLTAIVKDENGIDNVKAEISALDFRGRRPNERLMACTDIENDMTQKKCTISFPITLDLSSTAGFTAPVTVTATDSLGNTKTERVEFQLAPDRAGPIGLTLKTLQADDGTNNNNNDNNDNSNGNTLTTTLTTTLTASSTTFYINPRNNTFVLHVQESGSGMRDSQAWIELTQLRGRYDRTDSRATSCSRTGSPGSQTGNQGGTSGADWQCIWLNVTSALADSATATVAIIDLVDDNGNAGTGFPSVRVKMDAKEPVVTAVSYSCTSPEGQNLQKKTYCVSGDELTVIVNTSDNIGIKGASINLSSLFGSAYSDVLLQCQYTGITGSKRNATCTAEIDLTVPHIGRISAANTAAAPDVFDSDTQSVIRSGSNFDIHSEPVLGQGDNKNIFFTTIRTFDFAGNTAINDSNVTIYVPAESEGRFWTANVYSARPKLLDRQISSIVPVNQYHTIEFTSTQPDAELLGMEFLGCDGIVHEGDDARDPLEFLQTPAHSFFGEDLKHPFIQLTLQAAEYTMDSMEYTCKYMATTAVGSTIYEPEEINATLSVQFWNFPLGTPDASIQKRIEDVKVSWSNNRMLVTMVKLVNTFATICNIIKTIHTIVDILNKITIVVDGAADLSGPFRAIIWPIAKTLGMTTDGSSFLGNKIYGSFDHFCRIINCEPGGALFSVGDWGIGDYKTFAEQANVDSPTFMRSTSSEQASAQQARQGGYGQSFIINGREYQPSVNGRFIFTESQGNLPFDIKTRYYPGFGTKISETWGNLGGGLLGKNDWVSMNPRENLFVAMISFCLPGIIYNLDKLRQVDCLYVDCLRNSASSGIPTYVCEELRGYQKCKLVYGWIFNAIPPLAVLGFVIDTIKSILTNPAQLLGFALSKLCHQTVGCFTPAQPCSPRGACQIIVTGGLLLQLSDEISKILNPNDWKVNTDYCKNVEGFQGSSFI